MWHRLRPLPGGRAAFSRLLGWAAPYTATMGARVEVLHEGYCRAVLPDHHRVRNHLQSIHAVALVNIAELTGNLALMYSLPDDARFIVAGVSVDYVKKARGTIVAECHCSVPTSSQRTTYEIPVVMTDASGDVVARATLRSLVGPKKKA